MKSLKDLKGKIFNGITVISDPFVINKRTYYKVQCHCGRKYRAAAYKIKNSLKSCGCLSGYKHGHSPDDKKSPTYNRWDAMIQRCRAKAHFKNYGSKGIKVCKRWLIFKNFLEDMGECPPNLTLDRIDSTKGYYKENCRWADRIIQNNNTSRNVFYEYKGKRLTLSQWAREIGVKRSHIECHLRRKNRSVKEYLDTFGYSIE